MGISEQDIEKYMAAAGAAAGANTSVWVVKMPSVLNMAVFGPMAAVFAMRYNIMNASPAGIMIIGVDNMGNLRPEHIWLPREAVKRASLKKSLTHYEVMIETENGTIKYRMNKTMIGSSFHKKNVENVVQMLG